MHALRLCTFAPIAVALLLATACGSESPSPVGPSPAEPVTQAPSAPTPSTSGATVTGTVSAGTVGQLQALALAHTFNAAVAGVSVTVEGTNLSTTTGPSGAFALRGVPPGHVRLSFQGSGVSGTLDLDDVSETEEIELSVVVNGSTLELESQERVTGAQAQLEGKVVSVDYGARTLVVGTTTVMVPEGIPITNGNSALELVDVIVGARIHVKGARSGDAITATSVMVQQTGLERVTLSGVVSDLGGGCPTATFKIGSQAIAVNGSTIFVQGTCSDLTSEAAVEVKGFLRTDGSLLATMLKFSSKGNKTVEVSGVISQLSGNCPARKFHIGEREIKTTGATTFATPCATLADGQSVTVKGKAAGNKVTASHVQ